MNLQCNLAACARAIPKCNERIARFCVKWCVQRITQLNSYLHFSYARIMKYSDVEPGRSWRNYHFGFENECDYKLREEQCDASTCCEKDYFSREKILTIMRTNQRSPMMWSRLPCRRSHCKQVKWKSKSEKILEKRSLRIGKRMWLQASRRTMRCVNALWERLFFLRKYLELCTLTNRRNPMIWSRQAFTL